MTWTYNVGGLATSPLFQVRLMIGDTLTQDQQLQDEEIDQYITSVGTTWGAAAACCRTLSAQMSRLADQTSGQSGIKYSQRSKSYLEMALQYDAKAAAYAGAPYAGGISITDMATQDANTDRVEPVFSIGMDDNFLPVPPVDTENEGSPPNGGF